jgi:hypothetical protein
MSKATPFALSTERANAITAAVADVLAHHGVTMPELAFVVANVVVSSGQELGGFITTVRSAAEVIAAAPGTMREAERPS